MKNIKLPVSMTINITQQDIDDIMCSALEGGITYWADRADVVGDYLGEYAHEQISRGGTLKIHVEEPWDDNDTEWYDLDLDKLLNGIKKAVEDGYRQDYGWFNNGELDTGEIDADVSDVIIQLALFDDVIYA